MTPHPAELIWADIERIRAEAPLVHNITNFVVMNTTANALLALGASPVMAHAIEEVRDMARIARAVVLNIGTLSTPWIDAMLAAGRQANELSIPVVIDPVGAGATPFRDETLRRLLEAVHPAAIRGNASEIRALHLAEHATKGVDSTHGSEEAGAAGRALAQRLDCVICISGATDLVIGEGRVIRIANGHSMMTRVTGLGCTASALIGAFLAVNPAPLDAVAHAMAVMGICGEMAAGKSPGPGSLQLHFLDALHRLTRDEVQHSLRWNEA